jgi:hypothetical protein
VSAEAQAHRTPRNGALAPSSFGFNLTSAAGFVIEWQDTAFNVGLGNLGFNVSAVPEPASVALLLGGLLALGAVARARRGCKRRRQRFGSGHAACACAASTSARTASVSSDFKSVNTAEVFTE